MKTKIVLLLAIILSASAYKADAQLKQRPYAYRPGLQQRNITPGEAFRLRHDQRHLRRDAIRFKRNDGRIGPLERRHLKKERRHLKRERFFFQHNRRRV